MFEKEKGIILEELAKDRTNPEYDAELFTNRVLWGDDPRSLAVLGTSESITNMDYDALVNFYRTHYRPAGMTVMLMGDFDPAEAYAEIARLYGGRPDPPPPFPARPAFPEGRGIRVLVGVAGMAAALPGVLASHTRLPVIGVPVPAGPLNGFDAILSMVQMPSGVPVATVALGNSGGRNAALLSARILAAGNAAIRRKLDSYASGSKKA